VYSEGGRNIIEAMQRHSIRRFIGIGSGGVEHDDPAFGFAYKYFFKPLLLQRAYDDIVRFEAYLRTTPVEWVFVRPAALTDEPQTGTYRVSPRYAPPKGTNISRADLAGFMLKQLSSTEYLRQIPTLAY
jgi:putative NADH-flavin reductase